MDDEIDEFTSADNYGTTREQRTEHLLRQMERDRQVRELSRFLPAAGAEALIPDPEPPSPRQRLRIHVPEVKTTLSMGAAAPRGKEREVDAGGANYDGFGVHSNGHLFIDIEKTIGVQSEESAFLQSQTNMAIGGKSSLIAGSRGGVIMAGGGGVTILGGSPKSWPANVDSDGKEPQEPKWVAPISEASTWVSGVALGIDALVGGVAAVKSAKETFLGVKGSKLGLLNLLAWGGGLGGVAASLTGAAGAATSLTGWNNETLADLGDATAGTMIYGQAGWVGATPLTMGLYSLAGTTIASPAGVAIYTGAGIEMASLMDVKLTSGRGKLDILSHKSATVKSDGEVAVISKSGDATLAGENVFIGASGGTEGQKATKTLTVRALETIGLHSKADFHAVATGNAFMMGARARIMAVRADVIGEQEVALSAKNVSVAAGDQVAIQSGGGHVKVSPSEVFIGMGPGNPPEAPPKPEMPDLGAMPNSILGQMAYRMKSVAATRSFNKKLDAWHKEVDSWQAQARNIKKTKSGVIIDDSAVTISVGGHNLTLDAGKVKHASLVIKK